MYLQLLYALQYILTVTNLDTSLFSLSSSSIIYEMLHFHWHRYSHESYHLSNYCWLLNSQFVFMKMNTNNLSLLSINFIKTTSSSSLPLHPSLTVSFPVCVVFSLLPLLLIFTWRWSVCRSSHVNTSCNGFMQYQFPFGSGQAVFVFTSQGGRGWYWFLGGWGRE